MKIFAILVFLFSSAVFARMTDNQFNVQIEKEQIKLTPKKGFHFNAEGPASAVFDDLEALMKPTTKTEKLFVFKKNAANKKATLKFYICDDKKTVCELHEHTLGLSENSAVSYLAEKPLASKEASKAVYNKIEEVKLQSSDGRPTLLVFTAPWCPPCLRMMTETYNKSDVKKELSKVHFLKLNTDMPENSELSEKFKIKAIPTLVLLDKNGQESHRWLDFQEAKSFANSLKSELKKVDQTEKILELAQLGDAGSATKLGMRFYSTMEYAEAVKWLSLVNTPEAVRYKLAAEVYASQEAAEEDEKNNAEYLQTLQKAITLTSSELDRVRWTIDFLSKKNEMKNFTAEAQIKAQDLIKQIDGLLQRTPSQLSSLFKSSTYGDYSGFEKAELVWLKLQMAKTLDQKDLLAQTNQELISLIGKMKLDVARTGEMLNAIAYLREAGETSKVESLYEKLIKTYPSTYVYFEKYARFAQKQKQFEKAEVLASESLKYSEGNKPQLSLLKVQILKDLNKNQEAVRLIDETLALQEIQNKRYARTVKKLGELKVELKDKN